MSKRLPQFICLLLAAVMTLFGCATRGKDKPPLSVVPYVDLSRYVGSWNEIARLPHRFQKDCVNSRASYSLREDGLVSVLNECRQGSPDGPVKSVTGRARVVDPRSNAKLEVSFFWPFWGDYWIIDLDPDYRWAVVGHPSRKFLWILARETTIDKTVLDGIMRRLEGQGYDLAPLIFSATP
jgi:apolipoprotein D and lipocalin family protein